ncbi:MAG: undecaprenyl-phosphate glucose phosphotransferase [Bacteroidaceae bacterium]|nr:undecaprenyl-phosphate glucose phosphotransferase [Bacteroidaceae bacterium]
MKQPIAAGSEYSKWIVVAIDFILVSLMYFVGVKVGAIPFEKYGLLFAYFAYFVSILIVPPVAHNRMATPDKMANRVLRSALIMTVVFVAELALGEYGKLMLLPMIVHFLMVFVVLMFGRLLSRKIIKMQRRLGKDNNKVVFVGAGANLDALYDSLSRDMSDGVSVKGYFESQISNHLGDKLPLLGDVKDVIPWLDNNQVDALFCNLPHSRSEEILEIMNYCENHLIRFYSVPNVKNYVHRAMEVEFVDDMPILALRREPLLDITNRIKKRTFDILFSLFVLIFILSWLSIIVAIIMKITMPGPIIFKQKRNGLYGEEFWCYKFRSMKVNKDADRLQATKDDPRKTKWGNFMRKTNIDELPQFWNVLMGDMSVVGPRPHMVKHTEEYGALINKYMVRHYAKPGITGWAQVTGSRGETSELWMMEERIKKDIWYVENWNFWLDIRIVYMTVRNALGFEKGNAY